MQEFFFRFVNLHVANRQAAHGEAMRIARGVRGYALLKFFLKRCNLVRFRVYFDHILSFIFFSKITILYIYKIKFRYPLAMGNFS